MMNDDDNDDKIEAPCQNIVDSGFFMFYGSVYQSFYRKILLTVSIWKHFL